MSTNRTIFEEIAEKKEVEAIAFLTSQNINTRNNNNESVILLAANQGMNRLVLYAIEFKADPYANGNNLNDSALSIAAYNGLDEIVRTILSCQVKPSDKTNKVYGAILRASDNNKTSTVKILCEHIKSLSDNESMSTNDGDALHLAVAHKKNSIPTVKILMDYGANYLTKNSKKKSAFQLAYEQDDDKLATSMIQHDKFKLTNEQYENSIVICYEMGKSKLAALLREKYNKQNNSENKKLYNQIASAQLFYAASKGDVNGVNTILDAANTFENTEINPYELNLSKNNSPLSIAIENDHQKVTDCILRSNTKVTKNIGVAILEAAKKNNSDFMLKLMNKIKENKNLKLEDCMTWISGDGYAIHRAVQHGSSGIKTLKILLDHGDDCHRKNIEGKTAFEMACDLKNDESVALKMIEHPNFKVPDNVMELISILTTKRKYKIIEALTNLQKKNDNNIGEDFQLTNERINKIGVDYLRAHSKKGFFHGNQNIAEEIKKYQLSSTEKDKWIFLASVFAKLPNRSGKLAASIINLFKGKFNHGKDFVVNSENSAYDIKKINDMDNTRLYSEMLREIVTKYYADAKKTDDLSGATVVKPQAEPQINADVDSDSEVDDQSEKLHAKAELIFEAYENRRLAKEKEARLKCQNSFSKLRLQSDQLFADAKNILAANSQSHRVLQQEPAQQSFGDDVEYRDEVVVFLEGAQSNDISAYSYLRLHEESFQSTNASLLTALTQPQQQQQSQIPVTTVPITTASSVANAVSVPATTAAQNSTVQFSLATNPVVFFPDVPPLTLELLPTVPSQAPGGDVVRLFN